MKLVEAFALGVPVLITKHKVVVSLFKNEKDVLYIDDLSPSGVAEKILEIIEKPLLREKLRKNELKLANNFDYDKIARRLINVIEKTVDKNKNPSKVKKISPLRSCLSPDSNFNYFLYRFPWAFKAS